MKRTALALAWLLIIIGTSHANDRPLDRGELDKRAARAAYDVALAGTEMFNTGDQAGCARLYQGTLQALLSMLDHRPKLAKMITERLADAKAVRPTQAATTLREALEAIMGHPKPTTPLWERLGGEKNVRVLVRETGTTATTDPKVNFTRYGQYKHDEKGVARMEHHCWSSSFPSPVAAL